MEEIYSYAFFGEKIYLENMEKIAKELGEPHKKIRTIHVAGTNGKGSTSTMIEYGLMESGYKVGKYTSPHILKFNERISINGDFISDDDIVLYYNIIKDTVKKLNITPSFFEVVTSMMYKYFYDKKIDILVLETGLGGRLDATNISNGEITVITNISMDHMEQLGSTLESIAMEKLGIVKENSTVVIGRKNKELEEGIKKIKCRKVVYPEELYKDAKYQLDYTDFITKIKIENNEFNFKLFGHHQYENFLTAYSVLKELNISDENIKKAAEKILWPGRFEVIKNNKFKSNKLLIIDGAHNEDGILKIQKLLKEKYKEEDITVITSILRDKDRKKMASLIENIGDTIILTSIKENKRGDNGENLATLFSDKKNIIIENKLEKAIVIGYNTHGSILLVCGSLYLVSQVKEVLRNG